MTIEVYVQGKRFLAENLEDLDKILRIFKGWDIDKASNN